MKRRPIPNAGAFARRTRSMGESLTRKPKSKAKTPPVGARITVQGKSARVVSAGKGKVTVLLPKTAMAATSDDYVQAMKTRPHLKRIKDFHIPDKVIRRRVTIRPGKKSGT